MQKRWGSGATYFMSLLVTLFVMVASSVSVFATASSSTNYQVVETEFNATGSEEQCSGQYCARASMGDLVTSGTSGQGSTATFSALTEDEPLLEVIVEPGQSSVGTLSTDATTTKTAQVKVRNYLSGGYVMQLVGQPPGFGSHVLTGLASPTAPSPGTEQFGINLVANSGLNVGANPVQEPSGQLTFGSAEPDYSGADLFKYVSEDVVARGTNDWGQTNYTLTMIVNISAMTPPGHFSTDFAVIVTPFY